MANAKKSADPFETQQESGIKPIKSSPLQKLMATHKSLLIVAIPAIVVTLLLVFGVIFYVQAQIRAITQVPSNTLTGPIYGSLTLGTHGILNYNYSSQLVGYARVHYSESNAASSQLSLAIYPSDPSQKTYLVNVDGYCVQCFIGSSLLSALNSSMQKYGLILNGSSLNFIDINKLSSLPPDVTVVIPSGLMPNILLPNVSYTEKCTNYENLSILDLLSNGDTVIYVGRNFTRSVSCTGQIAQNTNQEISTLLPFSNFTSGNFSRGHLFFNNPTFFLEPGNSFGKVTSAHILNGTLVVMSNYPSLGWNNSVDELASDLSRVLESRFWITPLASGTLSLPGSNSSNATIFTVNTMIRYSPSASAQINGSYALLKLNLSNHNDSQEFEIPFRYTLKQNGLIGLPPVVGLSQSVQINSQIFNASKSETVVTSAPILNQNLSAAQDPIRIGQNGATEIITYSPFLLPSGYYIAQLVDQQGAVYSSALFYVANSTINATHLDFRNATFYFSVSSNGQPVSGVDYQININNAYNASGVVSGGTVHYSLPQGTSLSYGSGHFMVEILGSSYFVPYQYQNGNALSIPPLYIAFVIAAIAIVILNKVLIPPNIDEYYIDVPEIRPAKLEHTKESPDSILSVFEKVNSFYHWVHMPLTAEEIKSGISTNIKYGNTRMTITIRNTYAILNSLVEKGSVQMVDEYYAPAKWVKESGYSMEYLVIYRKLKDYCIANAMLMTEMGASSRADVIVTNKGAQNYIKIYSSYTKIKDIEISQKIRTFLVFLDEESRLSFMDRLYKSYSNNAEILKMAINYGNVRLVDSGNLSDIKL